MCLLKSCGVKSNSNRMKNRCESTCKLRKSVSFEQKGQTQRYRAGRTERCRPNKSAGLPAVCLIQARMALTATTQKIFCASIYRRFFNIDLSNAKHLSMQPYIFCIRLVLTRFHCTCLQTIQAMTVPRFLTHTLCRHC